MTTLSDSDYISQKNLSTRIKHGKATIKHWYKSVYELKNRELENQHCPHVLGIDEHFFSHKQECAITLYDLGKHGCLIL